MLACGNVLVFYFYKILFIYCLCVTIWMFAALTINICSNEWSHFAYYFFIIADAIYGVFSVFLGSICLFIDISNGKCDDERPAFFNFILVNLIFGLGCLMRSFVVIILFFIIHILRCVEKRKFNKKRWFYRATFIEQQFSTIESPWYNMCSICCEDYQEDEQIYITDCDGEHYFHEECIK